MRALGEITDLSEHSPRQPDSFQNCNFMKGVMASVRVRKNGPRGLYDSKSKYQSSFLFSCCQRQSESMGSKWI